MITANVFTRSQRSTKVLSALFLAAAFFACTRTSGSGPANPQGQLEADTGASWLVELEPQYGALRFAFPRTVPKPLLVQSGQTLEQAASAFLGKYDSVFQLRTPNLQATSTTKDGQGGSHITFAQSVGGVVVHGARMTVHVNANGVITHLNGFWVPQASTVSTTPMVTSTAATSTAEADLATNYPDFSAANELAKTDTVEIYAGGTAPLLVHQVYVTTPLLSRHYMINATTGAILANEDEMLTVTATGEGIRFYATLGLLHENDETETFGVEQSGTTYTMHRAASGTLDELTIKDYVPLITQYVDSTVKSSSLTTWDNTGNGPGSAVDAFTTMAKVDAFYESAFQRRSYDGLGSKIDVVVHQSDTGSFGIPSSPYLCNARYDAIYKQMEFGDGNWRQGIGPVEAPTPGTAAGNCYPLSGALDISAHEFTHGVVKTELNLDVSFQPGALDESFADIFGDFAEHSYAANDTLNMEIGEGGWFGIAAPLRSASDPSLGWENSGHDPGNYSNYIVASDDQAGDWGGRHFNSTIPTHAFFLMTLGGTDKTSQVTVTNPLGWSDSQRLWYAVLTESKMPSNAQFGDEARASLALAKAMNLNVEPVACAWVATGVLDNAFVRENFNALCPCSEFDGGVPQPPTACCDLTIDASAQECCTNCSDAGTSPPTDGGGTPPAGDGGGCSAPCGHDQYFYTLNELSNTSCQAYPSACASPGLSIPELCTCLLDSLSPTCKSGYPPSCMVLACGGGPAISCF
jgi:bacillolysin